jgi:hypothetical protein
LNQGQVINAGFGLSLFQNNRASETILSRHQHAILEADRAAD